MKRFGLLLLVVFVACDKVDGQTSFSTEACEQFGVEDPAPVPETFGIEIAAEGDTVPVFAVGAIIRYADLEDYAAFCSTWDEVVRTEVLPCLADDKPNLFMFPWNATLAAAFVGSRGAAGLAETETLPAFLS
ncbi:MAG: hypothetical protein OES21_12505 [Myxococcales bacterium]|nr:hypothetical protein [Myxococcales bacterium]